ncbi:MAG TPA: choice-of-anchor L domain-containing protein [Polyangiaceae bacterium]
MRACLPRTSASIFVVGACLLALACSGASSSLGSHDGGADGPSGASSSGGSGGSSGSSGGGSGGSSSGSGGGSGGTASSSGGSSGGDASDGCPPCDPGNVNLPGGHCDLDCSGSPKPPGPCDASLAAAGPAADFAKALGICQMATNDKWGLVSATYTQGYGSNAMPAAGQHALLPAFGAQIKPREGKALAVLSSGYAFSCDDPSPTATCAASGTGDPYFKGAQAGMTGVGAAPPGYPKATGACAVASTVYDVMGVTLQIKTPKNVAGFSFASDFFSSEWPEYVCSTFNDAFVVWLESQAWGGANGSGDLNLVFDSANNDISVNSPFLDECTPGTPTGCTGTATGTATCMGGPNALQGTGYYNLGTYCTTQSTGGGATGWLTTTAPVKGGETITLQFIVWDTGDANWDSSVLVDDFQWSGTPEPVHTVHAP